MDMQALIEEMGALIVKIKSGVATQGELEAFAAAAGELNERAIILRYKSYEAKVFGTPVTRTAEVSPVKEAEETPAHEPQSDLIIDAPVDPHIVAQPQESVAENEDTELSFDLFSIDNDDDSSVDARFIAHSDESKSDEPIMAQSDKIIPENEINPQDGIGAEEEMEAPIMHEEAPEIELADDESLMVYPEEGIEATIEHIENTTTTAEPVVDAQFIAHSEESMFDNETNAHSEESITEKNTVFEEEVPAQEAIVSTTVEVPAGDVHPVYKRLTNEDNSLAARLMAVRLETLKGAFGFNERLQIIQELFDGSNDDFTKAIERLDTLNSKNEARNIVSTYAHQYAWDKDSNLALEFIQKVERRYA